MAVAEKPVAEKAPRSPQQRLPLASLGGAVFLLVGLGLLFTGLPAFWNNVLQVGSALNNNEFLSAALLLLVTSALAVGLFYAAVKLERDPPKGFRAGTFFLFLWLLATLWIVGSTGTALSASQMDATVGIVVMVVVGAALLAVAWWLFQRPDFCRWLMQIEDQGWFHARTYKGNQGLRVRRGTMVGLLVIGFCGIFSLLTGNYLRSIHGDHWDFSVPYSKPVLGAVTAEEGDKLLVNKVVRNSPAARAGLMPSDEIVQVDKKTVSSPTQLTELLDTKYPFERVEFKVNREKSSQIIPVTLGAATIPVLYNVQVTVPLLLSVLLVWISWRIVHLPVFADFLIATEAEMNKVSWTTRRRLVQDTIVVLITVVLFASFLFVVDIVWIKVLGAVQVLQVDIRAEHQKQQEKSQW